MYEQKGLGSSQLFRRFEQLYSLLKLYTRTAKKTYRAMVKCDICGKEVAKTGMTAHKKTHENREEKEQLFLARRLAIGEKLGCQSKMLEWLSQTKNLHPTKVTKKTARVSM